ncbi:MAG: hypothetical protein KatS3mg102_2721 [Planctomycetota bacterium]|nr:MAG: hypothetical protein KatS3mg102_2721 [Planctomycetota bacterium]
MREAQLVSGWMTEHPVTVEPDEPVVDAYALMTQHSIRHLPVVEGGRLVGILSNRDLYRASPRFGGKSHRAVAALFRTPVREVMTREGLLTVEPTTTVAEAARLLIEAKVSSLPVLEGERLVGIITSEDLLRALLEQAAV